MYFLENLNFPGIRSLGLMSCSLMRWSRGKLRVLISALVRENEQEGDLGQINIVIIVITIIIITLDRGTL